jgi:hypothetical protein
METGRRGTRGSFFQRYLGAFIAALVSGVIGLLAVLTTPPSAGASRVGESVFGFLVMASLAFVVGWLITLLTRFVVGHLQARRTTRPSHRSRDPDAGSGHPDPHVRRNGVFVSYRRQDEPHFTGRLVDQLAARFGKDNVFMDVDSIDPGTRFEEAIERSLQRSKVMIVIIGRRWADAVDAHGARRLDDPRDLVRREIEAAITRGTPIIPVLAEGAAMPDRSDLPDSMADLTSYHALEVSHPRFSTDIARLHAAVEWFLGSEP